MVVGGTSFINQPRLAVWPTDISAFGLSHLVKEMEGKWIFLRRISAPKI